MLRTWGVNAVPLLLTTGFSLGFFQLPTGLVCPPPLRLHHPSFVWRYALSCETDEPPAVLASALCASSGTASCSALFGLLRDEHSSVHFFRALLTLASEWSVNINKSIMLSITNTQRFIKKSIVLCNSIDLFGEKKKKKCYLSVMDDDCGDEAAWLGPDVAFWVMSGQFLVFHGRCCAFQWIIICRPRCTFLRY